MKLLIYGAGNLAKLVYEYITATMLDLEVVFVVDDQYLKLDSLMGCPVVSGQTINTRFPSSQWKMFVAVGYKSMRARKYCFDRVNEMGYQFINVFASDAGTSQNVKFGVNNIIFPGVVIEPFSEIGNNNVFWSTSTICHDCVIGAHNFFAANTTVGGKVVIGNSNFFGFGSTVLQGIHLGSENLVSAHSLVTKDMSDLGKYRGVPARNVGSIDERVGILINDP